MVGLAALVPAVVDAVNGPVVANRRYCRRAGVAAALALGVSALRSARASCSPRSSNPGRVGRALAGAVRKTLL